MEASKNGHAPNMTPDAHIKGKKNLPMMQTTDLSMRFDLIWKNFKTLIIIQMNLLMHLQECGLNLHIETWVLRNYLEMKFQKKT